MKNARNAKAKSILIGLAGCVTPIALTAGEDMEGGTGMRAVTIEQSGEGFQLYRGGDPFYICGAGGVDHLGALIAAGGNSLRTWGSDQTERVLDEAQSLGLTVLAGIWIEHERHDFDYADDEAVNAQIARHCADVDRFKDHPAILMWAVGNEVSTGSTNSRVWDVIEAVASHIRKVDPHHPVMTVLPYVSAEEVRLIQERCPSIEILGFNAYGGINSIGKDARRFGWNGPFVVAEWGPDGNWEVEKTPWGAEIELSSTEKAVQRGLRYSRILEDANCLGSYAFFWGQKQETTPTWFNLFLETGASVEGVDVLQYLWTGSFPESRTPAITPLLLNGKPAMAGVRVNPGDALSAEFTLWRGDAAKDSIRWELLPESGDKRVGGDREARPQALDLEADSTHPTRLDFVAPAKIGAYRLFVYVENSAKRAASANFPFLVEVKAAQ